MIYRAEYFLFTSRIIRGETPYAAGPDWDELLEPPYATSYRNVYRELDWSTDFYAAMKVLCEGLLQKYPTQKLGFIIPFPFNEYKGAGTWKPMYDVLVTVLNYYSIPFWICINKLAA